MMSEKTFSRIVKEEISNWPRDDVELLAHVVTLNCNDISVDFDDALSEEEYDKIGELVFKIEGKIISAQN